MEDYDRLPWEPSPGCDYGDMTSTEVPEVSPCCGAGVRTFKCKVLCNGCNRLVANCNGD